MDNMGQNGYNMNYNNMQQGYGQPQMQYQNMQPGYGQPQMQYQNIQPGYGQSQMQYQNMQQSYGQPQMQYQNMQPGYVQPQMQYQNIQEGYGTVPRKTILHNKKVIIILSIAILVVILGVAFIPKLFNKAEFPLKGVELGVSLDEVVKEFELKDEYVYDIDAYKYGVEGFGVEGQLQFCFYKDKLYMVNWYVNQKGTEEEAMEKAIEKAKDYCTDKYGKPEKTENDDFQEIIYVWELEDGSELQLSVCDDYFVLRLVDFSII